MACHNMEYLRKRADYLYVTFDGKSNLWNEVIQFAQHLNVSFDIENGIPIDNQQRSYMPKLQFQLQVHPTITNGKYSYVWFPDEDISFVDFEFETFWNHHMRCCSASGRDIDVIGIDRSPHLLNGRPVIAQPTIKENTQGCRQLNNDQFKSIFYSKPKLVPSEQVSAASSCFVEEQGPAPVIALAQQYLGTDWGHDCLWCGAAHFWLRFIWPKTFRHQHQHHRTIPHSQLANTSLLISSLPSLNTNEPLKSSFASLLRSDEMIPCAVIPVPISHQSSHTIRKSEDYFKGSYAMLRIMFNYTTDEKSFIEYQGTDALIEEYLEYRNRYDRGVVEKFTLNKATTSHTSLTPSQEESQQEQVSSSIPIDSLPTDSIPTEIEERTIEQEGASTLKWGLESSHHLNYKNHMFGEVTHKMIESQYHLIRSGCLGLTCCIGEAMKHSMEIKKKIVKNKLN